MNVQGKGSRQQCNDNCCSNPRRLAQTSVALEGRNCMDGYTLYIY